MILKQCEKYNDKLDFKMLSQLNKARSISESLSKQKRIFNKLSDEVDTQTEIHLRKSVDIYDLLRSNKLLTTNQLIEIYNIYENEVVNLKKVQNVIKLLDLEIDKFLYNPIKVLTYIIRENIFNNYSDEMSVLLFNYMLIKNNYHPIIFYNSFMGTLSELIKNGAMIESIYRVLVPMIEVSIEYNEIQGYISILDVKEKIMKEKPILTEKHLIKNIFIYGSIAQGIQTEYSDIDLLVIVEEYSEFKNEKIKKHIQSIFEQRVDLIFMTDVKNKMSMDEDFYTKRKKIF